MVNKILALMLLCSPALAQVIYDGTPEQRRTGIYESVVLIKTDAESGMIKVEEVKQDADVSVTSCVEYNDGECTPSEYFKATITDVKG